MSTPKIILYDAVNVVKEKFVSPYVLRVRIVLALKGLPYETEWVNMGDIDSRAKAVGALPTRTNADGSAGHTVPFISIKYPDSPKPVVLSDSPVIIKYLEQHFPNPALPLFPKETQVLDSVFTSYLGEKVVGNVVRLIAPGIVSALPPDDGKWFKESRKAKLGVAFEDITPQDAAGKEQAKQAFLAAFDGLAKQFDAAGEGNYRLGGPGGKVTAAEIGFFSFLWLISVTDQSKDGAWALLKDRNGGRWAKLFEVPEYKFLLTL